MVGRRTRTCLNEVKLTPEGWVYLVVLAFITVGSVLRNVNLLILMAGIMYAPLFLNWRLGVRRARALDAFRRLPRQIHANELVSVQWTCENRMSGMAAWNLVIHDHLEKIPAAGQARELDAFSSDGEAENGVSRRRPTEEGSDVKIGFVRVAAKQSAVQSYRTFFGQRGEYQVGPASLTTTYPFGLILSRIRFPEQETMFVGPAIGQLNPIWEQRVQSTAIGSESLKRQRAIEEDEFYALRPWRSGDSKKNIHWRTTAKYGQPMIKQHDQQNNRDFAMVLDLFSDPDAADASLTAARCESVLAFAATALLQIKNEVRGQVAVGMGGAETEIFHSRTHVGVVSEAMRQMAIAQPSSDPQLVDLLLQATSLVSSGTPVYVVSSRKKPMHFQPDQLMKTEQDPSHREQARLARRLRMVLPAVRWLDVESDEFKRVFTLDQESADEASLKKLSVRWGAHV